LTVSSPRFTARALPGTFRVETDSGPSAEALRAPLPVTVPVTAATPVQGAQNAAIIPPFDGHSGTTNAATSSLQSLVDRYQRDNASRTIIGTLPVSVRFPGVGPSLFLASELTAEGRSGLIELDIRKVN